MSAIRELIDRLRNRADVGVSDQKESWRILISKGPDFYCEITVPHAVLEWHASVMDRRQEQEVWSDWMDYAGYDDSTPEKLEAEMAGDILAFANRVSIGPLRLPLQIFQKKD